MSSRPLGVQPEPGEASTVSSPAQGRGEAEAVASIVKLSSADDAILTPRAERRKCRRVAALQTSDEEANARFFMALFLASWSIGFVALFFAQLYLRLDAVSWPPAGSPPPPRLLTGVSTLVAIASSFAYHYGLMGVVQDRRVQLRRGLLGANALAFLFLMIQLAAAVQAQVRGLRWDGGAYASVFWITAGFHYLHVVVGLMAGVWLYLNASRFRAENHLPVRLWGYYWHSIALIWTLLYLFVFLI
ncbi:MAG: cytochrome c oxidase subunit 3 [Myxococcota bacterium]